MTDDFSFSSGCDEIYSNVSVLLNSPSYPNPYPPGKDCTYIVSQPNGTYVNFSILAMDINCQAMFGSEADYLEIRDGRLEDSPLMGKWCGNGSNSPKIMQSTQNHLRIRLYRSNTSVVLDRHKYI